jgi:hypothetical protein
MTNEGVTQVTNMHVKPCRAITAIDLESTREAGRSAPRFPCRLSLGIPTGNGLSPSTPTCQLHRLYGGAMAMERYFLSLAASSLAIYRDVQKFEKNP